MEDKKTPEGGMTELLGLMKGITKRKMPNTMTFTPHRMKKRFARIYSEKPDARKTMSEHVGVGDHPRAAGLSQRWAAEKMSGKH